MSKRPTQDFSVSARFLKILAPTSKEFCFRVLLDDEAKRSAATYEEQKKFRRKLEGTLQSCWSKLAAYNDNGSGVFLVVNEGGQTAAEIKSIRALFIDVDEPHRQINFGALPSPSMTIESSPGRMHHYWLVDRVPVAKFKSLQKRLAAVLGSDPSVVDLPRVMRIPGFLHSKRPSTPFMTRIVRATEARTSYKKFQRALRAAESMAARVGHASNLTSDSSKSEGNRSDLLELTRKVAKLSASLGMPVGQASQLARDLARSNGQTSDVKAHEVDRALLGAIRLEQRAHTSSPLDEDTRKKIVYVPGHLSAVVDEAERALASSQVQIFKRGSELVHPLVDVSTSRHGAGNTVAMQPVKVPWLLDELDRIAQCGSWKDYEGGRFEGKNWPDCVGKTLLHRTKHAFPVLAGLSAVPILRGNGDVVLTPGYDPSSGLLATFEGKWKGVLDHPGRGDAIKALRKLHRRVDSFPFVSRHDRAVLFSALLTSILRPLIKAAPMHAFSAPTAGSGKTKLAEIVASVAMGRPNAMMAWGEASAEAEKRLGSALLAGWPIICFDNVEQPLKGDLLNSVLTEQIVSIRVLGLSKLVTIPMSSLLLATGNNLRVIGDLKRRVLVCNLDAKVERPELRHFKSDPVNEFLRHRREVVCECLTILMAYLQAETPCELRALGGYEQWTRVVCGALVWCGEENPAEAQEANFANDPELADLKRLVIAWGRCFASKPTAAVDVIRRAEERRGDDPALYEAVDAVATAANGKLSSKKLGNYLASNRDARINGSYFKSELAASRSGALMWRLRTDKT